MRKLVSLLLAVMLVMSVMSFNVMASEDTAVLPSTAAKQEDALAVGNLATSASWNGFCTNIAGNVIVAMEDENDAENTNKIFRLVGNKTAQNSSSVLNLSLTATNYLFCKSTMNRFSANIRIPSVTDTDATVEVFLPRNAYSKACTASTGFGVTFKNGGAYYYDLETETFVNFIPTATMKADNWYRVEAIMDNRQTTNNVSTSKVYMNAFVYDVANGNSLVGTSGWQYVSNMKTYNAAHTSFLGTQIQAYDFDENLYVDVDDFVVYTISSLPEYSVAGDVEIDVNANKYVSVTPDSYKVVGEVFNRSNSAAVLTDSTDNKAVRFEMDVRIPSIAETSDFDFLRLYSTAAGKQAPTIASDNGTTPLIEGTVQVDGTSLTVKAYNAETEAYDIPVTLNVGSSYTINENAWYKLVWDIDYTTFESPTAMLYVKDANGNIVAQTASEYAAQPVPKNAWDQWVCLIVYGTLADKTETFQFDNTNIYLATTEAGLNEDTRTVYVSEDFQDYEIGVSYQNSVVPNHVGGAVGDYFSETSKVTAPSFEWSEGMVLDTTAPITLNYTFTNPVPVANLTQSNIELYAEGIKLTSGYTIVPGEVDANNCTTTFAVTVNNLNWATDYIVRLKAGVVDYNAALSGGVPAFSGLYKDTTFSVAALVPDCTVSGQIIDNGNGTVSGKVTFTNNEESPLSCYAILAVYSGNKLVGIEKSEAITVDASAVDFEATVDDVTLPAGTTAKLFVWNNFETMRPWMMPVTIGE